MRCLLLCLAALLPLPAAAQIAEPAPETVALRFGWAPGDSAVVTGGPSGGDDRDRLRVTAHAAGLEVVIEPMGEVTAHPAAGWVVSEAGEFVAPRSAGVDTAVVRQEWEVLVGTWAGADVDLGETYHLSSVEPMPLLDGATVPALSQIRVTRAACDAAAVDLSCVRLHTLMRPDPVALRLAVEDAAARTGERVWETIAWELEAEVIARPETLRPVRASITRRVDALARDGSPRVEMERREYAFDWGV